MSHRIDFSYGKGDVIFYRTYARPLSGIHPVPESTFTGRTNLVFAANVEAIIRGDAFEPAYTRGINTDVIATDSMKNFILRHAASYNGATLEGFLAYVGAQFLTTYPKVDSIRLTGREIPFDGVTDLLFQRSHNEYGLALVDIKRTPDGAEITDHWSGCFGLSLAKILGNSFAGFVRDEYTTLPEDRDRALVVSLDMGWTYTDVEDLFRPDPFRYVPYEQVRDVALNLFHEVFNHSIQDLLYRIGVRILDRFPQLAEIRFEAQNRSWETLVNSTPDSLSKVFTEPRPPYGIQTFSISRSDLK